MDMLDLIVGNQSAAEINVRLLREFFSQINNESNSDMITQACITHCNYGC